MPAGDGRRARSAAVVVCGLAASIAACASHQGTSPGRPAWASRGEPGALFRGETPGVFYAVGVGGPGRPPVLGDVAADARARATITRRLEVSAPPCEEEVGPELVQEAARLRCHATRAAFGTAVRRLADEIERADRYRDPDTGLVYVLVRLDLGSLVGDDAGWVAHFEAALSRPLDGSP